MAIIDPRGCPLRPFFIAIAAVGCAFAGEFDKSDEGNRLPVLPQPQEWQPTGRTAAVDPVRATYSVAPDAKLGPQGYELTISADGVIRATAPTETGLLWARRTVDQLAAVKGPVPCGRVRDWPKYGVRGVMLDVGRKFVRMETLRAMLRDLAHYKLNEFHIHLNDDRAPPFIGKDGYSAFRLESETFPGLTAKDGHYTKAEFRAFMKEAAALGVGVVPEIDSPAHAGCFIRLRPELEGAYGKTHLALDKPAVRDFMEKLFAEYLDGPDPVFAGPVVHVGTDEYDKRETEPFRAYTDWMFRMVRRHGHEPRAWGSLDHAAGQTPVVADGKIAMDIWHNPYYDPVNALKAGYSVVAIPDLNLYIVPAAGFYFDYLDTEEIFRTWEPRVIAYRTFEGVEPGLLGGKFAIWNDVSGNGISEDDIVDRFLHAVPVIAEKTWTGEKRDLGWKDFQKLSAVAGEAPGVNLADSLTGKGDTAVGWADGGYRVAFDVTFETAERDLVLFDDGTSQVKVFKGGKIGFTRDGSDWTADASLEARVPHRLVFCGDRVGVTVEADGKAIGDTHDLKYEWTTGTGTKKLNRIVRTLHFPLVPVKDSAVRVSGLAVETGKAFSRVEDPPADDWDLDVLEAAEEKNAAVILPSVAGGKTCPGVVLVGGPSVGVAAEDVRAWVGAGYAVVAVPDIGEMSDRQAVETILRANVALRARPGVDPYRIGLACASRDGTLPALATGADRRFAFAVSVFDAQAKDASRGPKRHVERARGPFFFVGGKAKDVNPLIPDWKMSRGSVPDGECLSLGPARNVLAFVNGVVRASDEVAQRVSGTSRGE